MPPKKNAKTKNVRRTVWISETLWRDIKKAAINDRRTVSGWIRDRVEIAILGGLT